MKILSDCSSKITVNWIVDASTEDMNEYRIQFYMSDDYLTKRIDVYLTKWRTILFPDFRKSFPLLHMKSTLS